MKKQIIYMIMGVMLLFVTSCKREYLDPVPQTSIVDATAFDTPARILNQVNSLYQGFKSGTFMGGRGQIAGDIRGEDFINETTNLVTGADVWMLNPTGTSQNFVKNLWAAGYFAINLTNVFIDGMAAKGTSVVGAALSNNYLGEARFLRAVSYYQLLQHYARPYADGAGARPGLPLRLTGIVNPGNSDLARSTVAEVYAQILSDLNFAEANLPLTNTGVQNTSRAHRNSAIAFKTRVYLSMQNYAAVITEANKIVPLLPPFVATSGVPHALQADIVNVFRTPYNTTESIFSVAMSATAGDNPGTQNQLGFYWSRSTGGGEFSLNTSGIVADPGWTLTDRRRSFNAIVSGKLYLNTKFNAPSPYTDWAPVIRWPEVLLNLAEARARTIAGVDPQALALLNAVRQRSDAATILAPASQAALIAAILNERRIEFLGEGLRNIDLMRLLQTIPAKGSAPSKAPADAGYIWPISADEMSLNKLMTDN
jgi:starch-binding outer membrane protein, SusD/RagB family